MVFYALSAICIKNDVPWGCEQRYISLKMKLMGWWKQILGEVGRAYVVKFFSHWEMTGFLIISFILGHHITITLETLINSLKKHRTIIPYGWGQCESWLSIVIWTIFLKRTFHGHIHGKEQNGLRSTKWFIDSLMADLMVCNICPLKICVLKHSEVSVAGSSHW